MRFSTRLTLSAVIPALLLSVALLAALAALKQTEMAFARLQAQDQELATATADLYAQGLQMGQALRNIVLDPGNPKAYENLKGAEAAYDQRYDTARQLATVAGALASIRLMSMIPSVVCRRTIVAWALAAMHRLASSRARIMERWNERDGESKVGLQRAGQGAILPCRRRAVQIAILARTPSASMSAPRPRAITSPRSITRYWSASSAAKS